MREGVGDGMDAAQLDRLTHISLPHLFHSLERFVAKNGISQTQLLKVFASQPICALSRSSIFSCQHVQSWPALEQQASVMLLSASLFNDDSFSLHHQA